MVRPDPKRGTLTLEDHFLQLKETLPPHEQELLGQLLQQVQDLRSSKPDLTQASPGPTPVATNMADRVASEMPSRGGETGEDPAETPAGIGMAGAEATDESAGASPTVVSEMPSGTTEMPAGTVSQMPAAVSETPSSGSEMPAATSEMPQALGVPSSFTPEPVEAFSSHPDQAETDAANRLNEMPASMPGLSGDYQMPPSTSIPF